MKKYTILSVFLLFIAFILRFWFVWEIPFHYDELSAIFRARFPNWQAHWQLGIFGDGHPPGVQTLLWLWVQHIGESPAPLHILAALCGMLSCFFLYMASDYWLQKQGKLIFLILCSTSFLFICWSQQIRPYTFGMAAVSLGIWFWSRMLHAPVARKKDWMVFGIACTLSAYIHHFAALTCAGLWLSGMLWNPTGKKEWGKAAVLSAILYLPGLSALYQQLKTGGLQWLGKPTISFIPDHVYLLLNKQSGIVTLLVLICILGFPSVVSNKKIKTLFVFLALFLLPLVTGYLWSVLHTPVLQHTVLLFSAPFLYLSIAYIFDHIKRIETLNLYFSGYVFLFMVYGLYQSRHYTLGYKDGYAEQIKKMQVQDQRIGMYLCQVYDGPADIFQHHAGKYAFNGQVHLMGPDTAPFQPQRLWKIWRKSDGNISAAVNSGSHPLLIPLLEHWSGHTPITRISWIGTEYLQFSSEKGTPCVYSNLTTHSTGMSKISAEYLLTQPNAVIVFHIPDTTLPDNTELICATVKKGKIIDWRSSKKSDWRNTGDGTVFLAVKTADIPGINARCTFEIGVKINDRLHRQKVEIRSSAGNPYLYGAIWP
ncbi:MAG: glycosyltransferase family 39 protein [Bacteroidetes bacterium]|nr:glycosyltransferase family 39 protein [Bacteroidota bacterium]